MGAPDVAGCRVRTGRRARSRPAAGEVEREGAARWELQTTLKNLTKSVAGQPDHGVRAGLQAVLDQLRALL